jgi:L-asparaginase II
MGPEVLECGAHAPSDGAASADLIRNGDNPSSVHNNCSGKHSGFVCTAVHLGEDPRGYIQPGHPVQRRVGAALSEMTGVDLAAAPCGCDGCGIPSYAIPLRALARGMARMVDTAGLGRERARAAGRLMTAMAAEPFYVSGTGSFVTECMRQAGETVRVKTGAEGVYAAALPRLGYGLALKIEDGAARAAELAMATLLSSLRCFSEAQHNELQPFLAPVLRNVAGVVVGSIRPTEALSIGA